MLGLTLAATQITFAAESADKAAVVKEKIQTLRTECSQGRTQVLLTLEALSRLAAPNVELRPQFDKFKADLVKMEAQAKTTRERAISMKEKGEAFFAEMEEQVKTIKNEDIQKESAKRVEKRRKSYNRILTSMFAARDQLVPLMSDLNDIKKLLDSELSSSSVASTKKLIKQANWNGEDVRESLQDVESELDRVAAELAKYK
jgi:predicted  nucleic acid-binding Zn-ribbon protein